MINRIKETINNPFIKNVVTLSSGTAFAQLINMLFSPLITRLYGPQAYGIMGTFSALISLIIPVAALTYPIAIVLPKDDDESSLLVNISIMVSGLIAGIAFILLSFFHHEISILFNLSSISSFLFLIPLVIFFAGLSQTLEQWLIRKQKFSTLSKSMIGEPLVINGAKFIIGLFYPSAIILVVFTALKRAVKFVFILFFSKDSLPNMTNLFRGNKDKVIKTARKYRDFPLFRAPHTFLNSVTTNLPLLLLSSLFGPASAGFYSIGKTVVGVPSTLIGKSVGDVFYPKISEAANNKKQLAPLVKKSTIYLGLIGIIPYAIIIIGGPWIFSLFFGQEWIVAGEYARWLSIWIYSDFIRLPSLRTLPVLSIQNFLLFYTIVLLIAQTGAFLVGYYIFNNDIVGVALFSIVGAILNIILIFITINRSKKVDNRKSNN